MTHDEIRQRAEKARNEWSAEHLTEGAIADRVADTLCNRLDEVITDILGFDEFRWIDARGTFGREIQTIAQDTALNIITQALKNFRPSRSLLATIRTEYERQLRTTAVQVTREMAENNIERIVASIIDEGLSE